MITYVAIRNYQQMKRQILHNLYTVRILLCTILTYVFQISGSFIQWLAKLWLIRVIGVLKNLLQFQSHA